MKIYLQIHHIDPGEEEKQLISLLEYDGIIPKYEIEGRTEDGNSIVIYIGDFEKGRSIEKDIMNILSTLSDNTLTTIENLGLNISLRLNVKGKCAYFSPSLLELSGKKGVNLYISNWENV